MDEQRYVALIYGLKLKFRGFKASMCKEKQDEMRKQIILFEKDIQDLIDDYESL